MKLLFDQNLPRSLVKRFDESFPDSAHVVTLGLSTATDASIYEHARDNGYAIVSKDSDFRQLSFVLGAPPKVIWLRVGNSSVTELVEIFGKGKFLLRVEDPVVPDIPGLVNLLVSPTVVDAAGAANLLGRLTLGPGIVV